MKVLRRLPRLKIRDVEELRRSAEHMVAAEAALSASSWQAAPAVRGLVKSVYEVLAGLYNRAEPVYLEITGQSVGIPDDPEGSRQESGETRAAPRGSGQDEEED